MALYTVIFAALLALVRTAPIDEHELSHATSYVSSNAGYFGNAGSRGDLSNLGEQHLSTPVYTQHVVTPIIKKVPILIKHNEDKYVSSPIYTAHHVATPIIKNIPVAYKHSEETYEEEHGPTNYEFHYAVEDKHTGDIKSQKESSDGQVVKGEYSLKEADGTIRIVKYTADKKSGFNAVVIRQGHAAHPQVEQKKVEVKKIVVPIADHHDKSYGQFFSHY